MGGGRLITRNRASYSCHMCRRRKVKCNKVHPVCGNCVKNGTDCVYDVSSQNDENPRDSSRSGHGVKRRKGTPRTLEEDVDELQSIYGHLRQTGSSAAHKGAIEARLDKLMSMIERIGGDQAVEAAERRTASLEPVVKEEPLPNNDWKRSSSERSASPRRAGAESSGDEFPIPSGQATDLVDPVGSLNLGHLSLEDGGRSRYVGTTYWAYISHEINELNQLLRDQNRSHDQPAASDTTSPGITDPATSTRRTWKESIDSTTSRSTTSLGSRESFQQSIIFPSGDSPSVHERVVEPEMLDHVPTRRQSHILYKGFMSGVHAISPVIHPPSVLKLYNAFWDWYDYSSYSGNPCPNPSFIPLLYAIWYGGSVTVSIRTIKAEFNASSRFALSGMYSEEVSRWLTKIAFPRSPSLQGLSAYLIVQTILSKEEEPLTSSLFVSLAMRVAQTMGLHRDPAQFGIEASEAEYRRRLWWHIMHMDGIVAMSSGLPPLVSDENYWDVRETSEVKDTLLGTPAAEQYEQLVASNRRAPDNPDDPILCGGPSTVNVYYLSARGKYVMARAVRRILKIQLGIKPLTRRDMEELRSILLDLQLKLNSIVNRIPEGKNPENASGERDLSMSKSPVETQSTDTELPGDGPNGCTEQYHSPVLVSFHKWARIVLSLFIDKAFCVAYQPFLKNARSRIWPAARQSALRHCHGFMEKFIQLATDPDFQPFHWSWPGNHQPMHATMIMLIDLYERPYSPEASKSRALIDRILALSGPDGGVVGGEDGVSTQRPLKDGGREAWSMIRRLRQKAWQKAGLNPEMLWTEQDQIQAGIASPAAGHSGLNNGTFVSGSSSTPGPPSHNRLASLPPNGQPADFERRFYNMTRSQTDSPSASVRPSPLRYSHQFPPPDSTSLPTAPPSLVAQYSVSPGAMSVPGSSVTSGSAAADSPDVASSLSAAASTNSPSLAASIPMPQQQETPPPNSSTAVPFLDPTPQNVPPMNVHVPTPPSMVDPNLNFDWDQWDAVFGQHLPVADELMELDPVVGLEFPDLSSSAADTGIGNAGVPGVNANANAMSGAPPVGANGGAYPAPWIANGGNMRASSSDWPGYC
ncbi:transcriptional regulator family: Fungal Specific TF [Penicillium lagena]|uniref:transcriptional regulator family: Fungal Specific TF n=1 Tax=Penicillium lagena TaxID=94218 RepID=UPI0025422828|nr:transcriptional regulator family: Fungal Specific TF [Penicillium lagena]KAJ5625252.1 transcriptional regulator family: Fungal Specific TF [Penicillium lagena]